MDRPEETEVINDGHSSTDTFKEMALYEDTMEDLVSELNVYSNDRDSWLDCTDFFVEEITNFFEEISSENPVGKNPQPKNSWDLRLYTQAMISDQLFRFGLMIQLVEKVNKQLLNGIYDRNVRMIYFFMHLV